MLPAWLCNQTQPFTHERLFTEAKYRHTEHKYISKLIEIENYKNQSILEINSRHGAFALELRRQGFNYYTGIDTCSAHIRFSSKAIGPYFQNSTLENWQRSYEQQFAAIFAFDTLQKYPNILESLRFIRKMLTQGGLFVGTTPYPFTRNILSNANFLHVLHPRNWKRLFHMSGFRKVQTYPMSVLPYLWQLNESFNPILPAYIPCLNVSSHILIIAEKGQNPI